MDVASLGEAPAGEIDKFDAIPMDSLITAARRLAAGDPIGA
jgi:hypothetical protein